MHGLHALLRLHSLIHGVRAKQERQGVDKRKVCMCTTAGVSERMGLVGRM